MLDILQRSWVHLSLVVPLCLAQTIASGAVVPIDSDGDGLSDQLEQRLLMQFSPNFMIGKEDCAGAPAEFKTGIVLPTVEKQNGTIYGQVFPTKSDAVAGPRVEVHFYHLWDRDCGPHGHRLDSEHVSVLLRASGDDLERASWKALYWYAAAHENTVCDVSQIARASTLGAEDRGARVWISPAKHASYLSEEICRGGCGADRCEAMSAMRTINLINLGEPQQPMNGVIFVTSAEWPLLSKMSSTNFPMEALLRLDGLPISDVAWANPGKHPVQGIISRSASVEGAIAESGHETTDAVSEAGTSTGNALQKSYRKTVHALGSSAKNVGRALGAKPSNDKPK